MINQANDAAVRWTESFSAALLRRDAAALAEHFSGDGSWRDIIGFGWDIETAVGRAEIAGAFEAKLAAIEPRSFRLSGDRSRAAFGSPGWRRHGRSVRGFRDLDRERIGRGAPGRRPVRLRDAPGLDPPDLPVGAA